MRRLTALLLATAVASGFGPKGHAEVLPGDSSNRPTAAEVRTIEAKVKMPRGARSLKAYVRYYYAVGTSEARIVKAAYIEKFWFSSSKIPDGDIAVVGSEAEIPFPADPDCSVVLVEYRPAGDPRVVADCSDGLIKK